MIFTQADDNMEKKITYTCAEEAVCAPEHNRNI